MWIMMSDAFFSIVEKDCGPDELLVRARRPGDIEKVFGRHVEVERDYSADYLFRAKIARSEVAEVLESEVDRVEYPNFKDSVRDKELHDAYMGVWTEMARVQHPGPYSKPRKNNNGGKKKEKK